MDPSSYLNWALLIGVAFLGFVAFGVMSGVYYLRVLLSPRACTPRRNLWFVAATPFVAGLGLTTVTLGRKPSTELIDSEFRLGFLAEFWDLAWRPTWIGLHLTILLGAFAAICSFVVSRRKTILESQQRCAESTGQHPEPIFDDSPMLADDVYDAQPGAPESSVAKEILFTASELIADCIHYYPDWCNAMLREYENLSSEELAKVYQLGKKVAEHPKTDWEQLINEIEMTNPNP